MSPSPQIHPRAPPLPQRLREDTNDDNINGENADGRPPADFVIAGAGIVGLVLALALRTHVGVVAEVYDSAEEFRDDVGAGMGMYPNGLRVLRDIGIDLFRSVVGGGYPYLYRRWDRHDGTEATVAKEVALSKEGGGGELRSFGIRRSRLQRELHDAAVGGGYRSASGSAFPASSRATGRTESLGFLSRTVPSA